MTKSIQTTIIVLGVITLASGVFAYLRGTSGPVYGFAIFMGLALIGTAAFSKRTEERK